jgi:hypothetical protein
MESFFQTFPFGLFSEGLRAVVFVASLYLFCLLIFCFGLWALTFLLEKSAERYFIHRRKKRENEGSE